MSPRPWVPVALLGALLAACSGSVQKGSSDSGTSGDGPGHGCPASPSAVYLTSTIGPGPSVASTCQIAETTPALEIGSVRSGVITGTAGTTVTCSVVPSGSGFDVSADVTTSEGSFAVSGTLPSTGTGGGITASVDYEPGGTSPILFSGTGCSVTLANAETPGFDPSTGPPIAAGRVWATVTCDDMTVSGQPADACKGILTFRLENCAGSPPGGACP
jgi:hypothetical protein